MNVAEQLKQAETKLREHRSMWLKASSKEVRAMNKVKYNKLFPEVEKLRKEFWKLSIKSSL